MTTSIKLTDAFSDCEYDLIESFCCSFNIEYYLFYHNDTDGTFIQHYPSILSDIDENDGHQFFNEKKHYICRMFKHSEDEIIEKFQRFLNVKAFI